MLQPQRSDIEPIASFDEERFGRWLQTGVLAYFLKQKGRMAFRPLQSWIGLAPDLVEDLVVIYELLEITEKAAFRAGLALALANTAYDPENVAALESLLNLASAVQAWEVLSIITDKHRLNWLTNTVEDDELLDASIRSIVGLAVNAGPTAQTANTVKALIELAGAEAFPPEYAEPVLIALCRLRPQQGWSNLQILRPKLDVLLAKSDDDVVEVARAAGRRRLVNSMRAVIGRDAFVKTLRAARENDATPDSDWWMSTAIAVGAPHRWTGASAEIPRDQHSERLWLTSREDRVQISAQLNSTRTADVGSRTQRAYSRSFPREGPLMFMHTTEDPSDGR